ncbi:hypothetical protein QYF61_023585 [Mycteria americana]|uniref:Uncharacterized protein n=1 Tax=Mycteria americana TaxID=33587 RepID=A0AAN7RKK6_MYCAM|nr:hypothetical protein QYF61_023585 [Mycteria americana]
MSSYRQVCNYGSYSPCDVSCPTPYVNAWNQPCVTSCGDSRAVVYPPPVAIVFPGPILSSCPQESYVGTSAPLEIGSSFGYGSSLDAQSSFGSGAFLGGRYSYPCYSSRRFLDCVEDNFLTELVSEPTREGSLLDLLFVNREGLVGDVTVGGCLGHSDHEMTEVLILGEVRRGVSRTATLDFRRADFGLFRRLVDRVPWEAVLKGKGVREGWTFFKKEILKAQEQAVPMC